MQIERRVKKQALEDTLSQLSIHQEIVLVEAFSLGFTLQFTRAMEGGVLAIARKDSCKLTITPSGTAEYNSNIVIR